MSVRNERASLQCAFRQRAPNVASLRKLLLAGCTDDSTLARSALQHRHIAWAQRFANAGR